MAGTIEEGGNGAGQGAGEFEGGEGGAGGAEQEPFRGGAADDEAADENISAAADLAARGEVAEATVEDAFRLEDHVVEAENEERVPREADGVEDAGGLVPVRRLSARGRGLEGAV